MSRRLQSLSAILTCCAAALAPGLRELQAHARLLAEELGIRDLGDNIRDARAELPAQLVVTRLGVIARSRPPLVTNCLSALCLGIFDRFDIAPRSHLVAHALSHLARYAPSGTLRHAYHRPGRKS
jgi:hypothetical protein